MINFSPEILHILPEQVAATLQELNLEQCRITESQLESTLPVLSCCSQLRTFSLCGNVLSMAITEKLLSHTTGLINLSEEFYPASQESYSPHGALHLGWLAQFWDKLIEIMWDLGIPRAIWLSSSPCPPWGSKTFYPEEHFLLYICLVGYICQSFLLGTGKLKSRQQMYHESKTNPRFQTSAQCEWEMESWYSGGAGLQGECSLWDVIELLEIYVHTIKYEPQFLDQDMGLRPIW